MSLLLTYIGPLLGPVIGPVAGGFLASAAGWRWYDSIPLGLSHDNLADYPLLVGPSG